MFARNSLAVLGPAGRNHGEQILKFTPMSIQLVRWRRTRFDRLAKNKVLIKRRPVPNEWEDNFFKIYNNRYRTELRAVRNIFVEEAKAAASHDELSAARQRDLDSLPDLLKWNEQENQKTKLIREARLVELAKEAEADRQLRLPLELEEKVKELQRIEELVRQEKEASKEYITMDNMEEKIEEAISQPKNYNFRVTRDGAIILPDDSGWVELKEQLEADKLSAAENS